MSSVTLLQFRDRVRKRADIEGSLTRFPDVELNDYINNSIRALYDLLAQKFGNDYYYKELQFTLLTGTDVYALPSDFFKMLGVDLLISSPRWATIKPFTFSERNFYSNVIIRNSLGIPPMRYRLMGNNIVFRPIPNSGFTVRICYVPLPTDLSADGDTFDGIDGWEEYAILDSAIKCAIKDEQDISQLMALKQEIKQRIEEAAENRDAGFSERVSDTRTGYFEDYYGQNF